MQLPDDAKRACQKAQSAREPPSPAAPFPFMASKRPLCVCELAEVLGLPEYKVSRHLSALKKAGFITSEHKGPWVYYEPVSSPLLSALAPFLTPSAEDLQRLETRTKKRRKNVCAMER